MGFQQADEAVNSHPHQFAVGVSYSAAKSFVCLYQTTRVQGLKGTVEWPSRGTIIAIAIIELICGKSQWNYESNHVIF